MYLATELSMEVDPELTGRDRLKRLREIKRELVSRVREVEKERNDLRQQRDNENKAVKDLFEEARVSRQNRDDVNEDVKLSKALRDLRKEDADKALNELEQLEEGMKDIGVDKKKWGKRKGIAKQIKELEFKLETSGMLTPPQEKEIIDRIEELTQDIGLLEVADEKRDEIRIIQKRLRSLRGEQLSHHKEVKKLAQQSQEYHDIMMEKIKEARKIRASADKNHKAVLEISEKIKAIRKDINLVTGDTDKIRKELGEETAVERKKRKQIETKAREEELDTRATDILARYKAGQKLGFEEFKLIIGRGLLKEN